MKDVSTSSKFSILSNVSSLASGGIFEADRDDDEDTVRAEDMKQVGPEMGHIKGIKNKAMRTEEIFLLGSLLDCQIRNHSARNSE